MKQNQVLNHGVKTGMIVLFLINIIPTIFGIFDCCIHVDFMTLFTSQYRDIVFVCIICIINILALILLLFIDYKKYNYIAYCLSASQLVFLYSFCLRGHSGWYEWLWYVVCFFLIAYSVLFPIYVHTSMSKIVVIVSIVFNSWFRLGTGRDITSAFTSNYVVYFLEQINMPIREIGGIIWSILYLVYSVSSCLVIPIMFLLLYTDRKEKNQIDTSQKFYFEHRSVALCIFLSFTTFGIYFIYWFVRIVKQVKEFHGDYSSCAGEVWLNLLVPFYGLYWLFTRNRQMYLDAYQRGETMKDSSGTCLVFAILGMPLISYAIMQNNMNRYTEIQKIKIQNVPKPQIPVPSHVNITREAHINNNAEPVKKETNIKDKLKELQDMLSSGLITQEDYDNKKQEILKQM